MKRFVAVLVCAVSLVACIGLFACSSGSSGSSAASASGSASASAASASSSASSSKSASSSSVAASSIASASSSAASTAASGSSASAASSATSTSSGSSKSTGATSASSAAAASESTSFNFVDECIDEHNNVTLYALTELKGWQLETLLDQLGYEWDSAKNVWLRKVDGAQFSAVKETGVYTQETYDQMNEKGGAIVAVGFNTVGGYKNAQEALKGNAKCVVEDSYFSDDGSQGIAIFYGPSMKEYLAIIGPASESTTQFMIFSKEAVGSGMLDQMMGEQVGGSFNDVWKSVTGQDSYGH